MTPQEIVEGLKAIRKLIGTRTYVSLCVTGGDDPVRASCYPDGIISNHCIYVTATTFEEAIENLRAKVTSELTAIHKKERRRMALLIMQKTFEYGACTDTALRGEGFSQESIDLLGQEACVEAEELADSGPFFITPGDKANVV